MIRLDEIEIEHQRQIVRSLEFGSAQYDEQFDILHQMCMEHMSNLYKKDCGILSPYTKTQYDD